MFIIRWFKSILQAIGLWKKEAKLIFLGLDNAGKSTLLHYLKTGKIVQIDPTHQPVSQEVQVEKINFKTFDLGGHDAVREIWDEYAMTTDAIVYLVDLSDPERFPESRKQLDQLLSLNNKQSKTGQPVPILVLANKIDIAKVSVNDMVMRFGLQDKLTVLDSEQNVIVPQGTRPLGVFSCSVTNKIGFDKGFKWLSGYL